MIDDHMKFSHNLKVNHSARTWRLVGTKGTIVSINMDTGAHEFGPDYNLDEAASVFWDAVGQFRNNGYRLP